jgi:predicted RNA binding protein YcfA (HicA-like mRNA interferase family)
MANPSIRILNPKTAEFVRLLTRTGFVLVRRSKKHVVYEGPDRKRIVVWSHAREIPNGTYRWMLEDAGLE